MSKVKERILSEALELFGRQGFERVTVRDIAAASEITMPTLYHHFGDKKALYVAVIEHAFEIWTEEVVAAVESGPAQLDEMLFRLLYANMRQIVDATSHGRVVDRVLMDAVHNEGQVEGGARVASTTVMLVERTLRDLVPVDARTHVIYLMMSLAYGAGKLLPLQHTLPGWEAHVVEVEPLARRLAAITAQFLLATYGADHGPQAARLRAVEAENDRLKILLGDAMLQIDLLKGGTRP